MLIYLSIECSYHRFFFSNKFFSLEENQKPKREFWGWKIENCGISVIYQVELSILKNLFTLNHLHLLLLHLLSYFSFFFPVTFFTFITIWAAFSRIFIRIIVIFFFILVFFLIVFSKIFLFSPLSRSLLRPFSMLASQGYLIFLFSFFLNFSLWSSSFSSNSFFLIFTLLHTRRMLSKWLDTCIVHWYNSTARHCCLIIC